MRVKLLIALALASVFLLAGVLPAGAVTGANVVPGVSTIVFQAPFSPLTSSSTFVPGAIQTCPPIGAVNTISANTISLAPPNINAVITLGTPAAPGFIPPNFVGPSVECPPFAVPVFTFPTFFDP